MNNTELLGRVQIHLPHKKKNTHTPPPMTGRASGGTVQGGDVLRVGGAFPRC